MDIENSRQNILDTEHLRLLSISHYISGGLTLLFSVFIGFYFIFFALIIKTAESAGDLNSDLNSEIPVAFFSVFLVIIGIILFLTVLHGLLQIASARFLKLREYRIFSFIIAITNLIFIPYGTILGVMTILVLSRPSVKHLYENQ